MRRLLVTLAFFAVPLVGLALACGDEEPRASSPPPPADGSGTDVVLGGDTDDRPIDSGFPVGDVCGDKRGFQSNATWPLTGGCATRAGAASGTGPQTGNQAWRAEANTGESAPAHDATGLVWVGTVDGEVLALGPGGAVQYMFRAGGAIRSSPAVDSRGRAIVGSEDGKLYGLARGDGTLLEDGGKPAAEVAFALELGPIVSSPVIGGDGTIYVGTTAGELVAATEDGPKWSARTNDTRGSSPAIGQDGTIYVGSTDHHLHAVRPDGSARWSLDLGAEVHGSPAVGGDGTIYIGTADGVLHAITADGASRWKATVGGDLVGAPAVRGAEIYVGSTDKALHALSAVDGSPRWTYPTLGAVATPVIDVTGRVLFGSADGKVYVVSARGTLAFAMNAKGRIHRGLALGPGSVLYVATETGVVAFGP